MSVGRDRETSSDCGFWRDDCEEESEELWCLCFSFSGFFLSLRGDEGVEALGVLLTFGVDGGEMVGGWSAFEDEGEEEGSFLLAFGVEGAEGVVGVGEELRCISFSFLGFFLSVRGDDGVEAFGVLLAFGVEGGEEVGVGIARYNHHASMLIYATESCLRLWHSFEGGELEEKAWLVTMLLFVPDMQGPRFMV